jgi:hypothetical protein
MNSQQKGCLQIAALLILAATLYVPWTQSYDATRVDGLKIGPRAGAYSWIFTPPRRAPLGLGARRAPAQDRRILE